MSFDALAREIVLVEGASPAAVIGASVRLGDDWNRQYGHAGRLSSLPDALAVELDSYFDLASVTKPITALLAARAIRAGYFTWQTPLGALLEEARGAPSQDIPIELFLAHRAGLEAHRDFYAPLALGRDIDKASMLKEAASARREGCEGVPDTLGFPPVYSDLGYLLVGEAMERALGEPLDSLMDREVFRPLGIGLGSARQLRERNRLFDKKVAATEIIDWRGGAVIGKVHDENAWAFGGEGACGHAGIFGRAADVIALGQAVVETMSGRKDDWLSADDIEVLVRPREGGSLRAGFDGKSEEGSSAGSLFGERSIGHLGFTGTSLWVDPDRELVAALLTNRVHPSRENSKIREVRPKVHDVIARWAAEIAGKGA